MELFTLKKIARTLFILLVTVLTSNSLSAQSVIKVFSEDSTKFFEEMETFLKEARPQDGRKLMKEFESYWYGGIYTDEDRKDIYETSNFMLKNKMNAFPIFSDYLKTLMGFMKGDQDEDNFLAWEENLKKLIKQKDKRKIEGYLKFSSYFFERNALYKTAAVEWQVRTQFYSFEFDNEPYIVFPKLDLICLSKGDSAVIYETSGTFYPTTNKWVGKDGTVLWERAGFEKEKVHAEIKNYKIDLKSPQYEADSVLFYNSFWFDKPLQGKLTEKVLANVSPDNASYPLFQSFDKRIQITNIIDDVDFSGGFSQKGSKFIGFGNEDEPAKIIVYNNNTPFVISESKAFTIKPEKIISNKAKIAIYLDEDSITHPQVTFNILSKERTLSMVRTEEGLSTSPFINTYHQVEMYLEQISWKIGEPSVFLGPLKGTVISNGLFQSIDFFKQAQFDKITGIDQRSPLSVILNCSRKNDDAQTLSLNQVSRCWRISESQAKSSLVKLSTMGFVNYDLERDEITLQKKLKHFVFANAQKEDYDVIQFKSTTKDGNYNGIMNLLNNEIRMEGVNMVLLSDSQKVYVYPKNQKLTLKKNRDFDFSGVVNAGGFEYFGDKFDFSYANFDIKMPKIDSARLYVDVGQKDDRGVPYESMVRSTIMDLKGQLKIDNPGNKSGFKELARYPVFKSTGNSYVYYEKPYIQNNVYKKENFYFQLDPFEFDSLDNFPVSSVGFEGTLSSADIFPEFKEKLAVMSDLALGFSRRTPPEGFPAYKGKGTYEKEINLSNRGLRGDGVLSYLTSTIESNDFIFLPDSMNTLAQNYAVEESLSGVEFPPVYGQDVQIHWEPYNDFMDIGSKDKPIAMYDGSQFSGTLTNKPVGLEGNGMIAFQKAEVESNLMKFKFIEFDADTAEFRLKAEDENTSQDVLSFATNNVKAHVSFKDKKGDFISNGGGSFIDFPQNQYIAFMDKFTWYMEENDIELSATTKVKDEQGVQLEGAEFISVHPDQDSLRFFSKAALYDVKSHLITAKQVKYIDVADAQLYPDSELVYIEKKAEIRPLTNSQIVANKTDQFHKLYNCTSNIKTRHNYTSSGYYDYEDENKKSTPIYFQDIYVDSSRQTRAKGTISPDDDFTISPHYEFKGEVNLRASIKNLEFDGNGQIQNNCEAMPKSWFRFRGEIDPTDIYIPIDSILRNDKKNPIVSSIMIKNDSAHMYPRFAASPKKYSDVETVHAFGFMYFDKTDQTYKISNMAKLNELSLPGNYVSLDTRNCNMYSEGKLNLGVNLGNIQMEPVGNITYNSETNKTIVKSMFWLDFFFTDVALNQITKEFKKDDILEGVNFDRQVFEHGLQEYVGKEAADKLITQVNLYGKFKKFPDELNKTIFFNEVNFKWNQDTRSFQSFGKLGIGNIKSESFNKYVDGHIEIVKRRSGDILTIYFEFSDGTWYFIYYTRDLMQVLSSNTDFNTIIKETKNDKRKVKYSKGKTFSYMLSSPKKKKDFLKKFEDDENDD